MKYYTQQMKMDELLQRAVTGAYHNGLLIPHVHVHCRLVAALLPTITNSGSRLAEQTVSRILPVWGQREKRRNETHTSS